MSKTLVAGGWLQRGHRRGAPITVKLELKGEMAQRFDTQRGDQCPKDFAAELLEAGLEKIERSNPEAKVMGFRR